MQIIQPYIKGKSVLDIGSVGFKNTNIFFQFVQKNAAYVLGIELDKRLVDMYKDTYNIVVANAESYKSKQKFDVVLAGELIEHISNPGLFLDCSYANLKEGGHIIITTPNAYSFQNVSRSILLGQEARCKEHVQLYSKIILEELLQRHGFSQIKVFFAEREEQKTFKSFIEMLAGRLKKTWNTTLVVIAKKKSTRA